MKLSLIIPAKDKNDPKLQELLKSIEAQDFDKKEMEVLVITDGTSESAKAIGIKRAKGEVVGILASDNELVEKDFLTKHYDNASFHGAAYPNKYYYSKNDDVLNRYFSLIGGNDVLSFYMRKNDRGSYAGLARFNMYGSIGDNGYFIQKKLIENTDLDNYYHIDNAIEADVFTVAMPSTIWHKTGGNIFSFFAKRYRYGLQHAFNKNRRWHLVDFRKPTDITRFLWFIVATITVIEPLLLSLRGYMKIQDRAWFLHWPVCMGTLLTYGLLTTHLLSRTLYQSLFALSDEKLA